MGKVQKLGPPRPVTEKAQRKKMVLNSPPGFYRPVRKKYDSSKLNIFINEKL